MKHPAEEDLFMLAHRSIGVIPAARIWLHMRRCPECRAKYAQASAMSAAIAGAVRGGRTRWRPFDRTLRMQALISVLLLGATVYAIQRFVNAPSEPTWHNAAEGACTTETEMKSYGGLKPQWGKASQLKAMPQQRAAVSGEARK